MSQNIPKNTSLKQNTTKNPSTAILLALENSILVPTKRTAVSGAAARLVPEHALAVSSGQLSASVTSVSLFCFT